MKKNSTLLLIVDEPGGESEIIDVDELIDKHGKYSTELDDIFKFFNYSPSDEVINRILMYSNPR